MRHIRKTLLPALLLTMLLWPSAANAAPEGLVLSAAALTESQQALALFLYQPLLDGESRIDLPEDTDYDDVSPAMNSLLRDRPELFHIGQSYSVGYVQHQPDVARYVTPEYRMDVAQANLLRQELYAIARDLAAQYPAPDALHDALLARVTYGGDTDLRHTAVGALIEGHATCEGYAQALSLLYRTAGIPCGMVTGTATDGAGLSQPHAWNIADIGGPTLIDATWNDQEHLDLVTHWYFGLSTRQMAADHQIAPDQRVPDCGDQANWHRVRGLYAASVEEIYAHIAHLAATGEALNLRIADGALFAALAEDTYDFLGEYNEQAGDAGFYGGYSVVSSPAQGCVILQKAQ